MTKARMKKDGDGKGKNMCSRFDFRRILEKTVLSIVEPEVDMPVDKSTTEMEVEPESVAVTEMEVEVESVVATELVREPDGVVEPEVDMPVVKSTT
ncbi:unnamed protein product [Linum trigynum]|uniref:Uncharacterized protein n=1 Tax=Linum trigynum TaxID=586398 RepID=A0AAV2E9T5_9ROSI